MRLDCYIRERKQNCHQKSATRLSYEEVERWFLKLKVKELAERYDFMVPLGKAEVIECWDHSHDDLILDHKGYVVYGPGRYFCRLNVECKCLYCGSIVWYDYAMLIRQKRIGSRPKSCGCYDLGLSIARKTNRTVEEISLEEIRAVRLLQATKQKIKEINDIEIREIIRQAER